MPGDSERAHRGAGPRAVVVRTGAVQLVVLGLVAIVLGVNCGWFGGPALATWSLLVGGVALVAMAVIAGVAPHRASDRWLRSCVAVVIAIVVLAAVAFALD